jgi:peroxiredoxin
MTAANTAPKANRDRYFLYANRNAGTLPQRSGHSGNAAMNMNRKTRRHFSLLWFAITVLCLVVYAARPVAAQGDEKPRWSAAEKPIADQLDGLRKVPDEIRGKTTQALAMQIRALPSAPDKLRLAIYLAGLSTEGDFGHPTLQDVADTLTAALRERPMPWVAPPAGDSDKFVAAYLPAYGYQELAQLHRYEHVQVSTAADPHYRAAMAQLEAQDKKREHPDFTLTDLAGKSWKFADLRGHVVLINFWATWCPPCRKELPDLQTLYERYASQGLVILGISDEDTAKVAPFVSRQKLTYPVLLDTQRIVNTQFEVRGIPKSFVYDRSGKLVAQAMDMRTHHQFAEMLDKAGMH